MLQEAKKILSELKSKKATLRFPNLGNPKNLKFLAYADAVYASLEDLIILFKMKTKRSHQSANTLIKINIRLFRVVKNSLSSETLQLSEATDAGFLFSSFVQEIFGLTMCWGVSPRDGLALM